MLKCPFTNWGHASKPPSLVALQEMVTTLTWSTPAESSSDHLSNPHWNLLAEVSGVPRDEPSSWHRLRLQLYLHLTLTSRRKRTGQTKIQPPILRANESRGHEKRTHQLRPASGTTNEYIPQRSLYEAPKPRQCFPKRSELLSAAFQAPHVLGPACLLVLPSPYLTENSQPFWGQIKPQGKPQ